MKRSTKWEREIERLEHDPIRYETGSTPANVQIDAIKAVRVG